MSILYNLVDNPIIYKASQFIFAPGANFLLRKHINRIITQNSDINNFKNSLDVGCGPSSWLWEVGLQPYGLDICHKYSKAYNHTVPFAVTGSSIALPFADRTFDGVWCIGVLHHLSDIQASATIEEILRVCSHKGYIAILDAVLPETSSKRPLAALIRKLDRGKYMRKQNHLQSLFPTTSSWSFNRFNYALTGLEMLECTFKPQLN